MSDQVRVLALTGGLMTHMPPPLNSVTNAVVEVVNGPEILVGTLRNVDVLFVWDTRYPNLGSLLPWATNLRWIHVAGIGLDKLLSPTLCAGNITLTNSRGVFDGAIAEYVASVLLAWVKDHRGIFKAQQQGEWKERVMGRLAGQHAVVVGIGSIGRHIGTMLHKLGVEVTLVGRSPRQDPQFGLVRSSAELVAIAREANYLVLAAPLTDTTRGIVDSTVLRALGPVGYLVNVGRGPLVVEGDLVAALQAGELGGAALDVFDIEPLPPKSPLWSMPNVLVSPHISGNYAGFEEDLVRVFMDNLELWMAGKPLNNVIDPSLGYVPTFEPNQSTNCDLLAT